MVQSIQADPTYTQAPVNVAAITSAELEQRFKFLEFAEADVERLISINDLAQRYADSVIEDFYQHLLSFEDASTFFYQPPHATACQEYAEGVFLGLTQAKVDGENWK